MHTNTFTKPEVTYALYARQLPDGTEWHEQETTRDESDARYWLERNRKHNAAIFEAGAGREYVLVKRTTTFELLS